MTPDPLLAAVTTAADAHRDARDQLERAIAHARRAGHTGEQINAAVLGGGAPRAGHGSNDARRQQLIERTKRDLAEQKRERHAADPNGVTRTTVTKES